MAGEVEDEFVGGLDVGGDLGNGFFDVVAGGVGVFEDVGSDVAEEAGALLLEAGGDGFGVGGGEFYALVEGVVAIFTDADGEDVEGGLLPRFADVDDGRDGTRFWQF